MTKRLLDIVKEMNIEAEETDIIYDMFFEKNEPISLDIFPERISDDEKYNQAELFYQRLLDGDISESLFVGFEEKLHRIISTLWLYSKTYVGLCTCTTEFMRGNYYKYNYKVFSAYERKLKTLIMHDEPSCENRLHLIKELDELEAVMYCATRECAEVLVYFEDLKLFIYIPGLYGHCVTKEEKSMALLEKIATANNYYLWQ